MMVHLRFLIVISTFFGSSGSIPNQKPLSRLTDESLNSRAKFLRDVATKFRYSKNGGCSTAKPSFPYITIVGTEDVSELAVSKACTIVSFMTKSMPKSIYKSIARGQGIKLYPARKGYTVYSEFSYYNDLMAECKDRCDGKCVGTCTFGNQKINLTAVPGTTFYNVSYVPAENVLCTTGDPFNGNVNIVVREFGNQIRNLMPLKYQEKFFSIYNKSLLHPIWGRFCYGSSSQYDYWAVATEAFFMSSKISGKQNRGCGMNECDFEALCDDEMAARKWLRRHDNKLFSVLKKVYAPKHPMKASGLKICM